MVRSMASENKVIFDDIMLVFVSPYPLIKHYISVLRNEQMPCPVIKIAIADLGRLFKYEDSRD
ncbi:hypothetical protein R3W88_012376 [Solanum pinnatisectum]|uniref:Uncharacterized protein n=1 Tax=Solanum pinnatisectum TaxID=50273 RepID=A0AAV9LA60_9SOLN|nr:hypothetical protein R3W88_012376 [Solanum pinnatisectum]